MIFPPQTHYICTILLCNCIRMKIVIDSAIPFIQGVFEPYADVEYIDGASFSREVVADADALVVRTRTKCNGTLLEGSKVKIIATATIGFDHIDLDYCRRRGIEVVTAAGCNARGVLQWVAAALRHIVESEGKRPEEYTLGVVGVGNVGIYLDYLDKRYLRLLGGRVVWQAPLVRAYLA